ncbi:MAG: tRNA lysidine(34) synthetase TilS [Lysobacterales bacterium]
MHAVHFNHALQAGALEWHNHCMAFCEKRQIPFHAEQLDLKAQDGQSPEGRARHHRYTAIQRLLGEGDIFLTAHHADDNAETLFLNLMRGSGIDGLAGIPRLRKMGLGWVARPLLDFRRSELEQFLRQRNVDWIEDPSNRNPQFDRNFLRNIIFPELEKRWPSLVPSVNQTARHARQITATLAGLLEKHYHNLALDDFTFALPPLLGLGPDLQSVLLRRWITDQDIVTPPRRRLLEFLHQINASAAKNTHAELRWSSWMIKRHGQTLWLHPVPGPGTCPSRCWKTGTVLELNPDYGEVSISGAKAVPEGWQIGPRKTGAQMSLQENGPHRKLKELLRLGGVPPCLRDSVPVLYWHDEVAAVGDWLISPRFRQLLAELDSGYHWSPRHPLLRKLQSVSVLPQHLAHSSDG